MTNPRSDPRVGVSRRMFLGGLGVAALGVSGLETLTGAGTAWAGTAAGSGSPGAGAFGTADALGTADAFGTAGAVAPRPYFPADVTRIAAQGSLPDLFAFFEPGRGRVTRASEWPERAAELSDLMQYYLYGYKHPTPAEGSVFRQVQVPATTIVNFSSVFDFSTFTVETCRT